MSPSLDIVADLGADGRLSASAGRQVAAYLRTRARDVEAGCTVPVRVQIGTPLRSTRANNLYWAVLGRISLAYIDAGRPFHAEALHLWFKGLYLPAVAAEVEAETGEMLDVVRHIETPDGTVHRTLTTTALTRAAFPLYLERIASDDDVLGMGVDLSDLLEDARGLRSGKADESDELRLMEYPVEPPAPRSDRPAVRPPGSGRADAREPGQTLTMVDLYW